MQWWRSGGGCGRPAMPRLVPGGRGRGPPGRGRTRSCAPAVAAGALAAALAHRLAFLPPPPAGAARGTTPRSLAAALAAAADLPARADEWPYTVGFTPAKPPEKPKSIKEAVAEANAAVVGDPAAPAQEAPEAAAGGPAAAANPPPAAPPLSSYAPVESAEPPPLSAYPAVDPPAGGYASPYEGVEVAQAAEGLPPWAQVLLATVAIVAVIGILPTFFGMGPFGSELEEEGAGDAEEETKLPVRSNGGQLRPGPIGDVDKALSPFAGDDYKGVTFGEFRTLTAADVQIGERVLVRDMGEWQPGVVSAIKDEKVYVRCKGPIPFVWTQIKRLKGEIVEDRPPKPAQMNPATGRLVTDLDGFREDQVLDENSKKSRSFAEWYKAERRGEEATRFPDTAN